MATNENRLTTIETNFAVFVQEMHDFKTEMQDFRLDMRKQNEMRASEIKELRQSIDSLSKHTHNLTVAAMVGIGAAVLASVSVLATSIFAVYSLITR